MRVKMDFSGVYGRYAEMPDDKKKNIVYMDFRSLTGCDGYCDDEAAAAIRRGIQTCAGYAIHDLDNGNYHYVSKFWLEQQKNPFVLAMFDHHTDMQRSSLLPLTSCGSWLLEAVEENANLRQVLLVGPPEKDWIAVCDQAREKVVWAAEQADPERTVQEWWEQLQEEQIVKDIQGRIPLYISVDKDILSEEVFQANWDQGSLPAERLEEWIRAFKKKFRLIGLDLCGEPAGMMPDASSSEYTKSEAINKRLAALFEE